VSEVLNLRLILPATLGPGVYSATDKSVPGGSLVVKALDYKLEGREFETR
jgi:hypothetical protein